MSSNSSKQSEEGKHYAGSAKKQIEKMMYGIKTERDETKEMAAVFFRLLAKELRLAEREDTPSREEIKKALEQLKDVGRVSVFASISILPGGAVSLIGMEWLARLFGIKNFTFIPSAFRRKQGIPKPTDPKETDSEEKTGIPPSGEQRNTDS